MNQFLITATQVVEFIGGLTLLMLIHEMGHFFAAKVFSVESEEIGLGLPPRIAYIGKFMGTPVSINLLPIGAFVKPKGESNDNVTGGLNQLPPVKRCLVFLTGPFANLATAFVIFIVMALTLGKTDTSRLLITQVRPNSPAQTAGLSIGDVIITAEGNSFKDYADFQNRILENLGSPIEIEVERGEQTQVVEITPRANPPAGEGAIGIMIQSGQRPATLGESLGSAVENTIRYTSLLFETLKDMVSGKENANAKLIGMKGLFDLYSYSQGSAETSQVPGWASALSFFASISMSLGLINLAPIPALDGGRIFFMIPEMFFRVKLPRKFENAAITISVVALIILMLYINLKDFISPIVIPAS